MIITESHFIDKGQYQLHARRFYTPTAKESIFLLHGSIEDGRIFYSKSGKGLAPFLAERGYDVFVGDLRGKGKSTPKISPGSKFGQKEAIMEDMPDFISYIQSIKGNKPEYMMAHSWGGVIILSYLARFKHEGLKGKVFFGSKRDVKVNNIHKWFNIDLLWNKVGTYLVKKHGYLPATKFKIGSDNEAKDFYLQVNRWVYSDEWKDHEDGFDYAKALQKQNLAPLLSLTGSKDTHSGHPKDVERLLKEIGDQPNHHFKVVGRKHGYKNDYDHINLLIHPDAPKDHFIEVADWISQRC
ncbi:alpha/beta fold hydrolase [Marivirga sp. S37H4]|uniref:Alpha/beta fold hydrolase n=1 Tax=Marivirga aurantiaca TaxID=2802615 RepID=A0A934WYT0_9BACT|nr:alpha/beta fold hydrolase [Marivirga aurantiaca]MBK6265401.1 alpha/beta fold hydrolase [Marivirga aurantiaca]